jgi:multicomponent Na+:H+ antiporter subunit D
MNPVINTLTIAWIGFPFFIGFSIFIFPQLNRYLSVLAVIATAGYALQIFVQPSPVALELLDHFGVSLLIDRTSGYFILTNALVTAAVLLYCWSSDKTPFFYAQAIIVHGSLNAAFACTDFISLYVGLEAVRGVRSQRDCCVSVNCLRPDRSLHLGCLALFVYQQHRHVVLPGGSGTRLQIQSFL